MDPGHPLLRTPSLTFAPTGHGSAYAVAITDRAGNPLAACDAQGTIHAAGTVLLAAPVRNHGRRDQPLKHAIEVADGFGRPLGSGGVAGYGIGPRARKVKVAIADPQGTQVALLEPDKRGERLTLLSGDAQWGTVEVSEVKRGFLRKDRLYNADLSEQIPPALRPLVLAVLVRYDALLGQVVASANRD